MAQFDIQNWVDENPDQRPFRQAVHTILRAISQNEQLQASMIMKGGILLALSYESSRFTKDIDFSTTKKTNEFDLDHFQQELENELLRAVEELEYGLDCRIQKCRQQPPGEDKTFPTIQITVGYAYNSNMQAHKRLMRGQASQVIQLDYALNEPIRETDVIEIQDGSSIQTYTYDDLVAEKFRALLQQEVRNRFRRQDIYDLYFLLTDPVGRSDLMTKQRILKSLREKSNARDLMVHRESMRSLEIKRRSKARYDSLSAEIEGQLPPFEEIYETVRTYYEDLPW